MDLAKTRPLEPIDFRFRPLAPLAVAWSCDAELAVALDDAIHVLVPEFPQAKNQDDGGADGTEGGFDLNEILFGDENSGTKLLSPQFSVSLQVSGIFRPEPSINAMLCEAAGVSLPDQPPDEEFRFHGVGYGLLTRWGAALGQTVRVEWSPGGLGQNLRPVLTALTTHGSIVVLGEHIAPSSPISMIAPGVAYGSGAPGRSLKNWRALWGLGAMLPLPDETREAGFRRMDDRITSFAWAREILPGRALLAYANDGGWIVVMGVQRFPAPGDEGQFVWQVRELCRFDGSGPHQVPDPNDADFVPFGSAFSLCWSPWHVTADSRTATLAYIAHNHVGFRRFTLIGEWELARDPTLRVEMIDTVSVCLHLGADAFVQWEDAIWPEVDERQMARGIIATPFTVKPFQVNLCAGPEEPQVPHTTAQCATVYPADEDASTNPITGLIVHRPDKTSEKPPTPRYTLVRLSATAKTRDWFETTAAAATTTPHHPTTNDNNDNNDNDDDEEEGEAPIWQPQWAEYIRDQVSRIVPRLAAMHGVIDTDSESEEIEEEFGGGAAKNADGPPPSRVHPHRFRIWGLAASPGDGCSVALVAKHSTVHPHRRAHCRLVFAWHESASTSTHSQSQSQSNPQSTNLQSQLQSQSQSHATKSAQAQTQFTTSKLSTEAQIWEAIYASPTTTTNTTISNILNPPFTRRPSPLRSLFNDMLARQLCLFCDAHMAPRTQAQLNAGEVSCENGHAFAACATSSLAIMAPGTTRLCAVCGLRCLAPRELASLARTLLGPDAADDAAVSVMEGAGPEEAGGGADCCGGCGGKFVI